MKRRRIVKAEVKFISLVPRGANQLSTLYKSDTSDETYFDLKTIVKGFDDEKGELTAVVYAPELRDSQGDVASAEVIKDAMYRAAQSGFDIDIRHDGKAVPRERAYVAESFIIQKGDPRFVGLKDYSGKPVDPTGGWGVVFKIEDQALRTLYKSGEWNGVSMGGKAIFEIEKETETGDITMTAEELKKAMDDNNKALGAAIASAVSDSLTKTLTEAGVIKKAEDKPAAKPKAKPFTGPFTPAGIKKHALMVQKNEITENIDFTDPASVTEAAEAIEKIDAELAEFTKADDGNASKIKALESQIASLRKASNQSAGGSGSGNKKDEIRDPFIGLEKTDEDDNAALAAAGSRMAQLMNGTLGSKK